MDAAKLDEKARRVLYHGIRTLSFLRRSRLDGVVPGTDTPYPGEGGERSEFTDVFVAVDSIIRELQEVING